MDFFDECKNMSMNRAGYHFARDPEFNAGFFAATAYLGYAACCEGDYSLDSDILDDVVRAALASPYDEISIEEACLAAGVDFDSLDHGDIQYILKQFASEKGGF